jgi:hypothetical protein
MQILNAPVFTAGGKLVTVSNESSQGQVVLYLTTNNQVTGQALYNNVYMVFPQINTQGNYTYDWSLSGDRKTLTINAKLDGVEVEDGTLITSMVIGN